MMCTHDTSHMTHAPKTHELRIRTSQAPKKHECGRGVEDTDSYTMMRYGEKKKTQKNEPHIGSNTVTETGSVLVQRFRVGFQGLGFRVQA